MQSFKGLIASRTIIDVGPPKPDFNEDSAAVNIGLLVDDCNAKFGNSYFLTLQSDEKLSKNVRILNDIILANCERVISSIKFAERTVNNILQHWITYVERLR